MATKNYVNDGTASVTAGAKTVTFADVSLALMKSGDQFMQKGASGIIDTLDLDAGTAELVDDWGGPDTTAQPYTVMTIPVGAELANSTRTIMQYLNGPILSIAAMMDDNAPNAGDTLVWDSVTQGWANSTPANALLAILTTDNDVLQRKSGAVVRRTPAQLVQDTGLAVLTSDDMVMQRKSDAVAGRTMAQLLTDLGTAGAVTKTGTETLTNKTLTSPTITGTTTVTGGGSTVALTVGGGALANAADFTSSAANGVVTRYLNGASTIGDIGAGGQIVSGGAASDFGINVRGAHRLIFGINSASVIQTDGSNLWCPTDNHMSVGAGSFRMATIYAATGTINTSDEDEKDWRGALTDAEFAAGSEIFSEIGGFKFLDAIAAKGADSARLHIGVRAQRVKAILEAHGLDAMSYAFLCYDEWGALPAVAAFTQQWEDEDGQMQTNVIPAFPGRPAGSRYGIRPDELGYFLMAVMDRRLTALESV